MRSSIFSRFDRNQTYYRERPARRVAEGFSLVFLLSVAFVATLTTARADAGGQAEAPTAAATLALGSHAAR